jgi:hypothetical protein
MPSPVSDGKNMFGSSPIAQTMIDPSVDQWYDGRGLRLRGQIDAHLPNVYDMNGNPPVSPYNICFRLRAMLKDSDDNVVELDLVDSSGNNANGRLYQSGGEAVDGDVFGPHFDCSLDVSKSSSKLIIIQSIYRSGVHSVGNSSSNEWNDRLFIINDEREYDVQHEIFPPERKFDVRLVEHNGAPHVAFCVGAGRGLTKLDLTFKDMSSATDLKLSFDLSSLVPSSDLKIVSNARPSPISGYENGDYFGHIPIRAGRSDIVNGSWWKLKTDTSFKASLVVYNNYGSSVPIKVDFNTNLKPGTVNNVIIEPSIVNNVFKGLQISGEVSDFDEFKNCRYRVAMYDCVDVEVVSFETDYTFKQLEDALSNAQNALINAENALSLAQADLMNATNETIVRLNAAFQAAKDFRDGKTLLYNDALANKNKYSVDGNNVSVFMSVDFMKGYLGLTDDQLIQRCAGKPLLGKVCLRRYLNSNQFSQSSDSNKAPFLFSIFGEVSQMGDLILYEGDVGSHGYHFSGSLATGLLSKGKMNLNIKLKKGNVTRYDGSYEWDTMNLKTVTEANLPTAFFERRNNESLGEDDLLWKVSLRPKLSHDIYALGVSSQNRSLLAPLVQSFLADYSRDFDFLFDRVFRQPVTPSISIEDVYEKLIVVRLAEVTELDCHSNVVTLQVNKLGTNSNDDFVDYGSSGISNASDWITVDSLVGGGGLDETINLLSPDNSTLPISYPPPPSVSIPLVYRVKVQSMSGDARVPDGVERYSHSFPANVEKVVVPDLSVKSDINNPNGSNPTFLIEVPLLNTHVYKNLELFLVNNLGVKIAGSSVVLDASGIAQEIALFDDVKNKLEIKYNLSGKANWRFCCELSGEYILGSIKQVYKSRSDIIVYSTVSSMEFQNVKLSNEINPATGLRRGKVTFYLESGGHSISELISFSSYNAFMLTMPDTNSPSPVGGFNMVKLFNLVLGDNVVYIDSPIVVDSSSEEGPLLMLASLIGGEQYVMYRKMF